MPIWNQYGNEDVEAIALKLDQSTPQAVVNGSPIMEGVQFDITPSTTAVAEGLLRWNSTDRTLDLSMGTAGVVTQQIGQEMFIMGVNKTGSTLTEGSVVKFDGRQGTRPKFALAQVYPRPDTETSIKAMHRVAYTGMAYTAPIRCSLGSYPYYTHVLTAPAGFTVGEFLVEDGFGDLVEDSAYCTASYPNPVAGTHAISVRITDQEGSYKIFNYNLVVGTSNHFFTAPAATGDGSGSSPSNCAAWSTVYGATFTTVSAAKDKVLVARAGTYTHGTQFKMGSTYKPCTLINYPSELPVFDGATGGRWEYNSSDCMIAGCKFINYDYDTNTNHFLVTHAEVDRCQLWRNQFENCDGSADLAVRDNESIWHCSSTDAGLRQYLMIAENTYTNCYNLCAFDFYTTDHMLCEREVFTTTQTTMADSVWIPKASNTNYCMRRLKFDNPNAIPNTTAGIIAGFGNSLFATASGEICYNFIRCNGDSGAPSIQWNQSSNAVNTVNNYSYRNSSVGAPLGTKNFFSNNFVNFIGEAVEHNPIFEAETPTVGDGYSNVKAECQAFTGVFDANGRLTGSYSTSYRGKRGNQIFGG